MSDGSRRAVFLDRDGVINVRLPDGRYVTNRGEFEFAPGAFEALRRLQQAAYLLVVVTNQRGIARGIMTEEDLADVHDHMIEGLAAEGIILDSILHCPHERDAGCSCRKPRPGMIDEACRIYDIDRSGSIIIGDSISDMAAGEAAGIGGIYVGREEGDLPAGTLTAPDLPGAAELFLSRSDGGEGLS